MVRNTIESDFQSSKMAAGSHFVKKKLRIDLKWREIQSKVFFGHPKWPPAAIRGYTQYLPLLGKCTNSSYMLLCQGQ